MALILRRRTRRETQRAEALPYGADAAVLALASFADSVTDPGEGYLTNPCRGYHAMPERNFGV
jgi:hypothetical protein